MRFCSSLQICEPERLRKGAHGLPEEERKIQVARRDVGSPPAPTVGPSPCEQRLVAGRDDPRAQAGKSPKPQRALAEAPSLARAPPVPEASAARDQHASEETASQGTQNASQGGASARSHNASQGGASARSTYSGASTVGSDFIRDQLPAHQRGVVEIQTRMKSFVKGMVRGREMSVLSVDGQISPCVCSFDKKLRNFRIEIRGVMRKIPLSGFGEVCQGLEPEDIPTPLDECCATLVLAHGECISFSFENVLEREEFAMCFQIIMDGHGNP